MPDPFLQFGIRLLAEAADLPAGEAIRFLFEHYRCAAPDGREGLVMALIGEVTTARAMHNAPGHRHAAALSNVLSERITT